MAYEQIFAYGGVALGAILTHGTQALTDRSRRVRERASRWDARRLDAYSEYASALKAEVRRCLSIAGTLGLVGRQTNIPIEIDRQMLNECADARASTFDRVLLLGSAATVQAAREWQDSVWDLANHLRVGHGCSHDEFEEAFRVTGAARNEYVANARNDLEVKLEDVAAPENARR